MNALTFLGTAGGIPMSDRSHSSILLETGGHRWLLDAGEPCSGRLKTLGIPFASLDGVFITHGHSDHISGFPMIVQGTWLEGRKGALPVYLPGELIGPLRHWLDAVYLPEMLVGFGIDYRPWEDVPPEGDVLLDSLRVSTNPTTHLNGLREIIDRTARHRFLGYSLALDCLGPARGKRVVYSGDLGLPRDMDALLDKPCDALVCELAHFEPEELFSYLHGKPVRRLFLTHLTTPFAGRAAEIEAIAAKMLPGIAEIAIMQDGRRVEF